MKKKFSEVWKIKFVLSFLKKGVQSNLKITKWCHACTVVHVCTCLSSVYLMYKSYHCYWRNKAFQVEMVEDSEKLKNKITIRMYLKKKNKQSLYSKTKQLTLSTSLTMHFLGPNFVKTFVKKQQLLSKDPENWQISLKFTKNGTFC